jgi:hypothetical protein
VLDQDNTATATTSLHQTTSGQDGLYVAAAGPSHAAIFGEDYAGIGVKGSTTTGFGVFAEATAGGAGVYARSDTGTAVYAFSTSQASVLAITSSGYALQTFGRLSLDTSGVATIPAGTTSKEVTPGVDVTAGSFVLLTPGADIGTRRLWFTKNTTASTITIRMSSARTKATKISWLLLG